MRKGNLWLSPFFLYFALLTVFLYLPIAFLVIFSFNDSSVLAFPLRGFTLQWYKDLLGSGEMVASLRNSLVVGGIAATGSTILGFMAALVVTRFDFPGRNAFVGILALPLVVPYVILASALLITLRWAGIPLSLWTVAIGHIIITLPESTLIIAARLIGFEENLEEAAMDLGATYWGTLFRVTIPIAAPALAAAFLTDFTTSFNEFAVAFFLAGTKTTLPIYIWSQLRVVARFPLVVALSSVIIFVSVLVVLLAEWLRRAGQSAAQRS